MLGELNKEAHRIPVRFFIVLSFKIDFRRGRELLVHKEANVLVTSLSILFHFLVTPSFLPLSFYKPKGKLMPKAKLVLPFSNGTMSLLTEPQ